ncbi:tetratricopeptide repeat protein [Nostoc sp. 'Peltigera membranacea cyanobiont' 232]|uniref:tetratricopeptide repeat protein n=1 Tax=Nostoc sp. 'Peltigera membranacea cyanobiont' 232 TaxID=2014531 RepID=UPI000B9506DF|nr:tetratricopeptide repeat protein [Nostoc sp. 'Peltigera membranacea cyanobiont' 232]OYE05584.1 pilus assembly protein PilF [Nostoc sp. 'Peltigera membranacea cyanobiont' 232]
MQWADFLANEAATNRLSPEQTAAFVERLKTGNSGKSEAKLASELNIGAAALKKRMTEVYDSFAKSCPELATSNSRGKLEKLRACLTNKYNGGQDAHPTIKQNYENIPPAVPLERFVGREAELEKLHQQLQTSRQVAIVAVAGMGGVGKTELATQYAKQHLQNYQGGVCWLSAQGIDVGIQILRFAQLKFKLIAPDDWELADRLKYCWQNWEKGEVLLVFDDVTDYKKQVQPYLPPESPRFKVLLTTRLGFDRTLPQLPLGVLKPLAAMKLLKLLVDRERIKSEPWVAREIYKFLGYLPLALELVGRYLDTMPDLSLEKLLKRLEKKRLEHEAIAKANPLMRYEYGVAEAFALSWEKLDENARFVGCWLSLYALADIPFSVEMIKDEETQELWEKAIAELRKLHLIQRQSKGIYRLHPLIRQFFQMKLDESSEADKVKTNFTAQMLEVAKQIPQQPNREDIFNLTPHIPHLAEVATHLSQYLSDEDFTWPLTGLSRFYNGQGLYQQAEPWYKLCVEVTENRLGLEHPDVVTSLNNLAVLYVSTGRYSKAESLYQRALELSKRLLGDNHLDVATSLNNLAGLYESTGRYSEAETLFQQALELSKRLLGGNHPHIANSLNNLAVLYRSTGRYNEAESLFQQALELRKRLLGDNHPNVANSLNNLAELYRSTGRYSKAEPLFQQALELSKRLLGDNHPNVANSLNNLAELYRSTGRYSEAEPLFQQALELRKRLLGDNHPHIATSLNNLALLYRFTGRYSKAELLFQQALELSKRFLGDNHPHVANSLNNLAELYGYTGRYSEAEPLFQQALELSKRLLGDNHPDIAISLNNLATLYYSTGRYNEAELLFQQALAICKQTLDVDHPDTIRVWENYAIFLAEIYR